MLDVGDGEPGVVRESQFDHAIAVLCRSHRSSGLVWRLRGRDKDYRRQPEGFEGFLGDDEVTVVDRVESASQHTNAHGRSLLLAREFSGPTYLRAVTGYRQWKSGPTTGLLTAGVAVVVLVAACSMGAEEPGGPAPGGSPVSPLAPVGPPARQARPATVVFSGGSKRSGQVWLTPGKRLKIFERAQEKYREFALADVVRIDVNPEKEVMERVWRWKEHASDEKVYTGEAYPWRKYVTTLAVRDRKGKLQNVVGDMTAVLYLQEDPEKKPVRLLIHRREKGEVGQTLQDLVYVTAVVFETPKEEEKQ